MSKVDIVCPYAKSDMTPHGGVCVGCNQDLFRDLVATLRYEVKLKRDAMRALKQLRIDANRLCDRNQGGTYEEDCRRSIERADAALSAPPSAFSRYDKCPVSAATPAPSRYGLDVNRLCGTCRHPFLSHIVPGACAERADANDGFCRCEQFIEEGSE